jgi:hypothetical protein
MHPGIDLGGADVPLSPEYSKDTVASLSTVYIGKILVLYLYKEEYVCYSRLGIDRSGMCLG